MMTTRSFAYEVQQIFPVAIATQDCPQAEAARALLSEIGFDLESNGNAAIAAIGDRSRRMATSNNDNHAWPARPSFLKAAA